MPFSTYAANKVLDCLLRGVTLSPPSRVWVSLHTADPGNTGANEVSTGTIPAYARQDPANGGAIATGFTAAASKATDNTAILIFPENNGTGPVTVTHIAIWDALTGGNCLLAGSLSGPRTINPTDELAIRIGELDIVVV